MMARRLHPTEIPSALKSWLVRAVTREHGFKIIENHFRENLKNQSDFTGLSKNSNLCIVLEKMFFGS
jgi:hypothetical protein